MRTTPPVQIGKIGKMGTANHSFSILGTRPSLWLDAADEFSIVENSGSVSLWRDKSGNNNHAVQSTGANQPSTDANMLNGQNVLTFDGADEYLTVTNASGIHDIGSGNYTFFAVYRLSAAASFPAYFISGHDAGSSRVLFGQNSATQMLGLGKSSYDILYLNGASANTTGHIGLLNRSGNDLELIRDGSLSTSAAKASDFSLTELTVGANTQYSPAITNEINGDIGEVLLFDRSLSSLELNQIGQYLKNKWALSWTNI